MAFQSSVLFQLLAIGYFTGVAAETCHGAYTSIYCMFGCCNNAFLVYCCMTNGLGIGLIVGAIVVVLSIIGICFRRRYVNRTPVQYANYQGGPSVSVVSSMNSATSQGYGAPPPAYPGQP